MAKDIKSPRVLAQLETHLRSPTFIIIDRIPFDITNFRKQLLRIKLEPNLSNTYMKKKKRLSHFRNLKSKTKIP